MPEICTHPHFTLCLVFKTATRTVLPELLHHEVRQRVCFPDAKRICTTGKLPLLRLFSRSLRSIWIGNAYDKLVYGYGIHGYDSNDLRGIDFSLTSIALPCG
jgi:hypothetical protein